MVSKKPKRCVDTRSRSWIDSSAIATSQNNFNWLKSIFVLEYVKVISLDSNTLSDNSAVTVSGWGKTKDVGM